MPSARVWAPVRATIDPDQVVLALLEAGDDPEKDLGAALLAVHRAGAAACQVVAAAPVPDEVALIRTLAECRGRVAPAVAECVSKSVDDPQYAHLLTRDVFDDAEQAALTLFRACVAKGVSPPLACQRVGHVFGVPREHLGRYFALATNPATGVVALVDAADRALLAHVAKVARSETEDTKVTISKAPEPERAPRNPDFEASVNRDAEGRFAEEEDQPPDRLSRLRQLLGISGAAPRVGGAPPISPEPSPTARRKRRTHVKRRVVTKPKEAVREPTRQVARQAQRSVARSARRAPRREIQARTTAQLGALRLPEPETPEQIRAYSDNVMATRHDPNAGSYHSLRDELTATVPVALGQYLRNQMVGQGVRGEPFVFRIGHLLDIAGEMELGETDAARDAMEHAANQVWGEQDTEHEPIVTRVHRTAENWADKDFIQHLRDELATDVFETDQGKLRRVNMERRRNIVEFEDPFSNDILLVEFRPATEGGPVQAVRVDEFVIGDGAVGRVEGVGKHTRHVLDPNQAYSLPDGRRPQQYFDEQSKAIVNRWWLTPIPEADAQRIESAHRIRRGEGDVDKAAPEPEQIRNPAFEATVNRDEEGQFAVEEQIGPPVVQPRYKRRSRVKRRTVTARQVDPQVTRQASREVNREIGRQVARKPVRQVSHEARRGIQRGLVAHLEDSRIALPELDDSRQYHVLSQAQMHELMRLADLPSIEGVRQLDTQSKAYLFGQSVHSGSAAAGVLREQVSEMVYDNEGGLMPRTLFRMKARNENELDELGRAINAAFDKDPALAEITIEEVGRDDYQVMGNRHPVPDQYLIEYDDDVHFDAPLELVEIGHYRTKDMMLRGKDSWPLLSVAQTQATPFNAPVQLYRLHNAGVRRFRAGRSD